MGSRLSNLFATNKVSTKTPTLNKTSNNNVKQRSTSTTTTSYNVNKRKYSKSSGKSIEDSNKGKIKFGEKFKTKGGPFTELMIDNNEVSHF